MRFLKFEIENFKGIRQAEIRFSSTNTARVYSLVGLNESGKTTVLEAIHSFSPDSDTEVVVGNSVTADQQRQLRVPRHRISDFTGEVSVKATISLGSSDVEDLAKAYLEDGLVLDTENFPEEITYERYQDYKSGNFLGSYYRTSLNIRVRGKRQRKFRTQEGDESKIFSLFMSRAMPMIAYFPTFVFDFPEKIYLSPRNSDRKNDFYRKLFQDILDYSGRGHTIEEHIISRIRRPKFKLEWIGFLPLIKKSNESDQIDQVIDIASETVTKVVIKRWNEIFKESTGKREIQIDWDVEKGLMQKLEDGSEEEPDEHDIYVSFRVKDGTDRFPIRTRSLGFRWFFSFLLFTQFRAARESGRPLVFLFDEPASNLHAAAQQLLLESFPEIARPPHTLIYSTHSHYMVEPKWLEQAYIVQNEASREADSVIDTASLSDASVDVKITPYRQFIHRNPKHTYYFQPIVDRLDIVPSKFDLDRGGVIVEGKSDYYILQYLNEHFVERDLTLFPVVGSGTMDALIGMMKGWGLSIRILLDADKAGVKERQRYQEMHFLTDREIATLKDFVPELTKIESLFGKDDLTGLAENWKNGSSISKKDILAIFQEHLAAKKKLELSSDVVVRARELILKLVEFAKSD